MRVRHLFVAAALAATLTACGGTDEATPDDSAAEDTTSAAPSDAAAIIAVAESDLGDILVDGEGMTLYLFTNDSPGESTCEGDCLAAWPPVPGPAEAGDGVDADLLGTVEATDGTTQATYNDMPLYYFAQDEAPGDVTGQGVNDVWYVVDVAGEAVTSAAPPSADY